MDATSAGKTMLKQHLIDPEICIRCNTCEATCPIGAITHDANNYVVDPEKCNACMDCVAPCPTGAIDNWFVVAEPFSVQDQFSWTELPPRPADAAAEGLDAFDEEAAALIAAAHAGTSGRARPPLSASKPRINLFSRTSPARAKVTGNYRITRTEGGSDVHHIVLDFGTVPFPVLEGQSIGVIPPNVNADRRAHAMRLYSVSSPRDGERPNTNNLSLTVKRVAEPRPDGSIFRGVASNWLCDLPIAAEIEVMGPFGATFLMPDDPETDIVMVCTGTGSAPFRAFTERRRRLKQWGRGRMYLFFGARTPEELPYFGPLQKVPQALLEQHLVFSRLPERPKEYVQDRMRAEAATLGRLLAKPTTHFYICGVKGLERGVEETLSDIAAAIGLDWPALRATMREEGRYHVETY